MNKRHWKFKSNIKSSFLLVLELRMILKTFYEWNKRKIKTLKEHITSWQQILDNFCIMILST